MGSGKITKTLAKFDLGHQVGKKMGLPDPSGDLFYGKNKALSPAELAQKNAMDMAKQQAAQASEQMQMQLNQANLAAQQGAMSAQSQQDREKALAEVQDASQLEQERPTVELTDVPVTTPRKKFRGQIGGAGKSPSVRV